MKQRVAYPILIGIALLVCVLFVQYGSASGNPTPTSAPSTISVQANDATTQTLIAEIKELRHALQDLAVNSSRMQIAVETWRVQQSIADRAAQDLQNTQDQIDGDGASLRQLEQTAKQFQEQINFEPNPTQKAALSRELQAMQANAEEVRQRLQRLQQRETEARSNSNAEKTKAQEARDALDGLNSPKRK